MSTARMIVIFLLEAVGTTVLAQDSLDFIDKRVDVVGIGGSYGFIIKHSESLRQIDDAYPIGISLDWSKQLVTKNAWEFCNCFPRAGISLSYWDWDNPEVLGSGLTALAYVEPYFLLKQRTNLFVRMGMGGAFLTNPYDEEENPRNLSYSTTFSFPLVLGTGLNYRWDKQTNIRLGISYNHISNGGIRTPNKGLNFPTIDFGVNRSLQAVDFPALQKNGKREPPPRLVRISIIHFSGWSNARVGEKDKFYVVGLVGNVSRWVSGRSALSAGTELILDFSRQEKIEVGGQEVAFQQMALLAGHEFWLGKVTFSQQLGVYYFNRFREADAVYQRYGLTYAFSENLFGGFNLKAHRHVADFIDFRVGYTF